ncbi:ABC transporter ATP-binding protein [Micromonospora sp. NPDC050276]|uniref:ABC transporter ATP-binding protein n=1 Tax=Micromonospora sp. NPDC050276 TaxID=3364278 RepID=UPI0037B2153E
MLWIASISTMLLVSVFPVAAAWATRALVDGLSAGRPGVGAGGLAFLAVAVVGISGLSTVFGNLSSLVIGIHQRTVKLTAESDLHAALAQQHGLRKFENPEFQNKLNLALQAGSAAPCSVLSSSLELLRSAITIGGFAGVLLATWWPMALLLMVTGAPMLASQRSLARSNAKTIESAMALNRRRLSYQLLLTRLDTIKEVKLLGLGELFHERMHGYARAADAKEIAEEARTAINQGAYSLLTVVTVAAGMVYVTYRAAFGMLSPGDVVIFLAAVTGVQSSLGSMGRALAGVGKELRLFGHYSAIVVSPPDMRSGTRPPESLRKEIVFEDVWFRYDEDRPWVFQGLDLAITAGDTLAVVGVNGAGKSTLLKLLCRFYDPDKGRITWDGVDLRQISIPDLRRRISIAFQDYTIYDLTVAENIGVGDVKELTNRAKVEAAARISGAHTVAEDLVRGYDTMLSRIFFQETDQQLGTTLSGGQGQRLALARSVMRRDADLLLLDEPSSNLDALAEQSINRAMLQLRKGRTSILISHRLSALRDADRIAVITDGRVCETGTHETLMANDGTYAEMFRTQAAPYQ